jgi:hypothetical protein
MLISDFYEFLFILLFIYLIIYLFIYMIYFSKKIKFLKLLKNENLKFYL